MKKRYLLWTVLLAVVFASCVEHRTVAYSSDETKCIGTGLDGTCTMRVYGRGHSKSDAYTDAGRQAVYDVMFSTVTMVNGETKNLQPIIADKRKYSENRDFFDEFFKSHGVYKKYIKMYDINSKENKFSKTNSENVCVTTVVVDRTALVEYLKTKGIIF